MAQGWVYVLINDTYPGMVKVGRTTRLPSTRVAELSHATGVPTPFILVFEQAFANCVTAERDIHAALDRCGLRVTLNREFFRGQITDVVRLIMHYACETGEGKEEAALQSGAELLLRGDRCLFGQGAHVSDFEEALRCYQLAARRGSLLAFERLGIIAAQSSGTTRGGRAKSTAYFKEGARRGNYYCYYDLAAAAAEDGHTASFVRLWDLFFDQRQLNIISEVEEGEDRYPHALRRYVVTCFALGLRPAHLSALTAEAEALVNTLAKTLAEVRSPPAARRMLIMSLQWAKQALLQMPTTEQAAAMAWTWLPRLSDRWRGMAA